MTQGGTSLIVTLPRESADTLDVTVLMSELSPALTSVRVVWVTTA